MFFDTGDLKYEDVRLMLHHTCDSDPSRNHLPVYYFRICGADGRTVGWCDFRIGHSDYTYYAGNIGYQVEEAYRGHHYAGKAIIILLELARRHGFSHLYVSCATDNIASRKSCEYAGGSLAEIVRPPKGLGLDEERVICVYDFDVTCQPFRRSERLYQ